MRRFFRDERGVAAVMTAMFSALFMVSAAFAIDVGYVHLQARKLQGMADLAAMAAANDLTRAQAAAAKSVSNSGWDGPISVTVTTGRYIADPNVSAARRFVAGATPINAAQVHLTSQAQLYFGAALIEGGTAAIDRSATATQAELASFSIGSRLASFNGGIANAVLSALTGGHVALTVMDYNGLASADVDVLGYLGALKVHADVASYDDALSDDMPAQDALKVLANTLADSGQSAAASRVNAIASASGGMPRIKLGDLIDAGPYGGQDRAGEGTIKASALDLVSAILTLGGQDHFLKLDLGATVPGLGQTQVYLAIGERMENSPWLAITATGTPVLHTAQARLYVTTTLAPGAGILSLNGVASINVPLVVELASAEAKLSSIACAANAAARKVTLAVKPSIGHVAIASADPSKLNDFTQPIAESKATLVGTLLLQVTGQARVDLGGASFQSVAFSQADIDAGRIKTVQTNDIAQASVASLLGSLSVDVKLLGLGIGLNANLVGSAVKSTLATAAMPLDQVLNTVTQALGLHLGEADVRVNGLRCRAPALVL